MADQNATAADSASIPAASPASTAPSEFPLPIEEFCTRLSERDKRVETIGAFAVTERMAGRMLDLPSAYQARYEKFHSRAV